MSHAWTALLIGLGLLFVLASLDKIAHPAAFAQAAWPTTASCRRYWSTRRPSSCLDLTVTTLAAHLGVSRKHLSQVVNEKAGVTTDMALRLSRAFNTTPELWLNLQRNRDLWEAGQQSPDWEKVAVLPGLAQEEQGQSI